MPVEFITLPDDSKNELQSLANLLWKDLKRRGYRVKAEPNEVEFPSTPAIVGKRNHETNYFFVTEVPSLDEINKWVRLAQSNSRDTRVTICCSNEGAISATQITKFRALGVRVLIKADDALQVVCEGRDLAFHAVAPERKSLKPRVRELLGEPLDRFEAGDWRTAFADACGVLEEECRAYLLKNHGMKRVQYQAGNKVRKPTKTQIKKMPLGMLKDVFCGMIAQNQIESTLCSALERLNPDRITRIHKAGKKRSEDALRRRVGTHIWLISNSLSILV